MTQTHRPTWTLVVASAAGFMNSLDTQVMATALPTLRRELGGSVEQLEWTMNAYSLAIACLLLTAAGLGDRFGRRRILIIGLVAFAVASAAAALSPDPGSLIVARAVQGAGAAAIMPTSLAVIGEAYTPERRGRAIGIWGAVLGVGGTLGPVIGGGLLEVVGWRGIFWINVPIGLAAAVLARLVVTESHGSQHRLDIRGVLLASAGSFGIAWGLVRASSHSWGDVVVWLPIALGLVGLGVFLLAEHRAPYPMMPISLFAIRRFSSANAATLLHYAGVAGAVFFLSQFFQLAQGADPVTASIEFMAWPLPVLILSPLVGALTSRIGTRPFLTGGMAMQALGMAWLALVAAPTTAYWAMFGPLLVAGLGLACFLPALSTEIVGVVPRSRMSIAAGVNSSLSQIGVVLGVAISATVFTSGGSYTTRASFTAGFVSSIWMAAAFAAAAAVVSLLGGRRQPVRDPAAAPLALNIQ
ncbi:MFS transporter [Humibacter sp.]|uniref:MFS transporter n=1 Tax=Humibacter sp. TaxID=1940291 RepID=UPI003F80893B